MDHFLEPTLRWFGPGDPVALSDVKMSGARGVVTALHHIPNGQIWPIEEIVERKELIEKAGLSWSVVESVPVHESIKKQSGDFQKYIDNYKQTLLNLGACGIDTVCYNFMPVLDWTRTNLSYILESGARALRYEHLAFVAFDLFILKRADAKNDYSDSLIAEAERYFANLGEKEKDELSSNIMAGLPGAEEGYTTQQLQVSLNAYRYIDADRLRANLFYFVEQIIPSAREAGIMMAIHPDDPPFSILGLARIMSTLSDAQQLLETVDDPHNGICFCTGSFGASATNDVVEMAKGLLDRIYFIHLRNVNIESDGSFYEAEHLYGDVDMAAVMALLHKEQGRRLQNGLAAGRMPFRSDHGHQMLDDLDKTTNPGYTIIGRMKGLAELRGLEMGIQYMSHF